ncbi:MAG: DUF2231 domain-containing protein [Candidatus Anammoxibacter sp.]
MKKTIVQKYHIHPIAAHFPSAFFPFSALFLILLIIKGDSAFEVGVKYTQWAAVLTNPFAIASGFIDWKAKYKSAMVPIFKKKIMYSIIAQMLAFICVAWHCLSPDVLDPDKFFIYIFLVLTITSTVFTFLVGRWGARLVYL